jgi:hypothetical protein
VTDRAAAAVLGLVTAALLAAACTVRLPEFWGDGATYYSQAWSLAEDLDLRYEARDVFRVRREFPGGPQGIFLKRASGGLAWDGEAFPWLRRVPPDAPRIYFAKAFTYPLAAAPFVAVFGTRGLLVANVFFLAVALAGVYVILRRHASAGPALAAAAVLVLATVAPVYVFWPTPEVFTLGVIAAGLAAWSRGRPVLACFLLGIAVYTKPYNVLLCLPLGLDPLLTWRTTRWRGALEAARRTVVVIAVVAGLFGLNKAITGEVNYQGGERKTFYGRFPFEREGDRDVTFGNSGFWMTTDQLGPLVEGRDEALQSRRTGPLRPAEEIRASFGRNLLYFWIGRFGGAAPYFFPAVLALLLFLALGPRTREGSLAALALLSSWLLYIWLIPDNWYGGGGTLGNRYFLNLLPLAAFFVPRGREWWVAAGGLALSAVFLGPMWVSPLHHSLRPGDHAAGGVFLALPPELTMLNDLAVFTESWRKKQPYGDTEGDAHKHWPADPKAYFLYFLGNGTYGRESHAGAEGFWLRGARRAEVVLRALEPVHRATVRITGGPAGDRVRVRMGSDAAEVEIRPGETKEVVLEPGEGFPYYDTFLYPVDMRSERTAPAPPPERTPRPLGSFVSFALEVNKRR